MNSKRINGVLHFKLFLLIFIVLLPFCLEFLKKLLQKRSILFYCSLNNNNNAWTIMEN